MKISLGKQIAVGDVVTVELKGAKISSAGDDANAEIPKKMTATLVDISEAAGWWTLLSEKESVSLLNGDEEKPEQPEEPTTVTFDFSTASRTALPSLARETSPEMLDLFQHDGVVIPTRSIRLNCVTSPILRHWFHSFHGKIS